MYTSGNLLLYRAAKGVVDLARCTTILLHLPGTIDVSLSPYIQSRLSEPPFRPSAVLHIETADSVRNFFAPCGDTGVSLIISRRQTLWRRDVYPPLAGCLVLPPTRTGQASLTPLLQSPLFIVF